tara:strand:+ start:229 stop:393 length:165 start_codon:yes stop_codon:yes gene_type:complete
MSNASWKTPWMDGSGVMEFRLWKKSIRKQNLKKIAGNTKETSPSRSKSKDVVSK